MGMSTYVVGYCPPSDKWKKMKKIYEACEAAGVDIPIEVRKFFNNDKPNEDDNLGAEVDIPSIEWGDENRMGIEVDLAKLPHDITHIRFYNSW